MLQGLVWTEAIANNDDRLLQKLQIHPRPPASSVNPEGC